VVQSTNIGLLSYGNYGDDARHTVDMHSKKNKGESQISSVHSVVNLRGGVEMQVYNSSICA
jgi:hypothetical protein